MSFSGSMSLARALNVDRAVLEHARLVVACRGRGPDDLDNLGDAARVDDPSVCEAVVVADSAVGEGELDPVTGEGHDARCGHLEPDALLELRPAAVGGDVLRIDVERDGLALREAGDLEVDEPFGQRVVGRRGSPEWRLVDRVRNGGNRLHVGHCDAGRRRDGHVGVRARAREGGDVLLLSVLHAVVVAVAVVRRLRLGEVVDAIGIAEHAGARHDPDGVTDCDQFDVGGSGGGVDGLGEGDAVGEGDGDGDGGVLEDVEEVGAGDGVVDVGVEPRDVGGGAGGSGDGVSEWSAGVVGHVGADVVDGNVVAVAVDDVDGDGTGGDGPGVVTGDGRDGRVEVVVLVSGCSRWCRRRGRCCARGRRRTCSSRWWGRGCCRRRSPAASSGCRSSPRPTRP